MICVAGGLNDHRPIRRQAIGETWLEHYAFAKERLQTNPRSRPKSMGGQTPLQQPSVETNINPSQGEVMVADGFYFDLPEDDYHAIPALSASGIKNLLISNPDFWFLIHSKPCL